MTVIKYMIHSFVRVFRGGVGQNIRRLQLVTVSCPAVTLLPHLLREDRHFVDSEAACQGHGAVEEASAQQRGVQVSGRLVLALATQGRPERAVLVPFIDGGDATAGRQQLTDGAAHRLLLINRTLAKRGTIDQRHASTGDMVISLMNAAEETKRAGRK